VGGIAINFIGLDPIKALYWSAIVNGVVAVPMLSMMMLLASQPRVMGEFTIGAGLKIVGWIATGIMTASVLGMGLSAML
jgi:Mn2+/Fe2+ NRAMP family transporter